MNNGVQVDTYAGSIVGYYTGKFLPFHNGHLQEILEAAQQVDVLFVAVGYNDELDKKLCEHSRFGWVSNRVRERWLTQAFNAFPNIRVLSQWEARSPDYATDGSLAKECEEILSKVGGRIDIYFSNKLWKEEDLEYAFPTSLRVFIKTAQSGSTPSSVEIREQGVYHYWDNLPQAVRDTYVKRVCICGVGSTGKSTLTKQLAALYTTNYVDEFVSEFYKEIGGCYDIMEYEDFLKIACGQSYRMEQAAKGANKVLFVDTDMVYTQFFLLESYGQEDAVIKQLIESNVEEIDLYIYLEPTIPHDLDGMRQVKTVAEKLTDNEILKSRFAYYGRKLEVVNSPDDLAQIKSLIDALL